MKDKQHFIHIASLVVLLSISVMTLPFCSRESSREQEIVARVGDRIIDWKLLRRSFNLEPKWDRGLTYGEAYSNQLNFLIEQKLFAQEALAEGLDKDPDVARKLRVIKEKEMMKELYREVVASQVQISDSEYEQAYLNSKKKVQFEYIASPDSLSAVKYRQLMQSHPVDEISLLNPGEERKGVSPYFSFGDMAPELETVVFQMQLGEISSPIRVGKEYMVVKLIDGEINKFMSKIDFAETKSKIRKVIFERHARKLSDQYIYNLLKDKKIEINPTVFFALSEKFSEIVQPKTSQTPLTIHLTNAELKNTRTELKDMANEVLVTFKDGHLTVKEFLQILWDLPAPMRPQVNMAQQLKKAIAVTVRNLYLVKEAYRRGLDTHPVVQYETLHQSDALLSRYYMKRLKNAISVTEDEIQEFMHKKNFPSVNQQLNGKLTPTAVREILVDYKFHEERMKTVEELKPFYPVEINDQVLKSHIPDAEKIIQERPVGFIYREEFY
ncbi:MAG: hypothetical protein D6748_10305 [Calditrichaeota bacterium]|nr:MAG: hypothetical protein D6748_10305 [Calditrichota bacterium]